MKSVLKCGLIGGALLGIAYLIAKIFGLPIFTLHIVFFPGVMMFAINDYLYTESNQRTYAYWTGMIIGLTSGMLMASVGFLISSVGISSYPNFEYNVFLQVLFLFEVVLKESMPLLLLSSFIVPATYRNKKPKEAKNLDILDEEI